MAELSNNPASALISDELKYQYQKLSQQIHLGSTRLPLKATPPDGYICRKCNTAGHWIQQCPYQKTSVPPPTYTCRICNVKGHWIYQCSQKNKMDGMMMPMHFAQNDIGNGGADDRDLFGHHLAQGIFNDTVGSRVGAGGFDYLYAR
jgi:hypothetical protein